MITATNAATTSTGTQLPTTNTSTGSGAFNLKPADFIKLMVTQLQHQDPTQPANNSELLSQMSNIGQLESSTDLQSTLKAVTLQTQIGSASALIGKSVTGIDAANQSVTGTVTSVGVAGNDVSLKLDVGTSLAIGSVSSITGEPAAAKAN